MPYLLEATQFPKDTFREKFRESPENARALLKEAIHDGEFRLSETISVSELLHATTGLEFTAENITKVFRERDFLGVDDFRLALSQLVWRAVDERMMMAKFIGDQLMTARQTSVIGVPEKAMYLSTPIEDNSVPKREGEPNTFVNTIQGYYEVDPPKEYRQAISISERVFIADRSGGKAIQHAYNQLNGLKIAREKRQLGYVMGTGYEGRTTQWRWGIESANTPNTWSAYNATAGGPTATIAPYVNSVTGNPLVNFNSLQNLLVRWSRFTDPLSGALVPIPNRLIMLVPYSLQMTAKIIKTASQVEFVDNQPNASTLRFTAPNPLNQDQVLEFTILSSQYVSVLTGNDTTWFLLDPTAFERNYVYNWREMDLVGGMPKFDRNIEISKRVDYFENYNTTYPLMSFKSAA